MNHFDGSQSSWQRRAGDAWRLVSPAILAAAVLLATTQTAAGQSAGAPSAGAPSSTPAQKKSPRHRLRSDASAPAPAEEAAPAPAAPEMPHWPVNDSPNKAAVTWDSQGLRIEATNASLHQILNEVSADTGAKVEGLGTDERVFGEFGPGQARDVLSQLLHGSSYNVLLIGDQGAGTPRQIVLSARRHENGPGNANSSPNPNENQDVQPDEDIPEQPEVEEQPPPQQPPMINRPPMPMMPQGPPGAPRTPQQVLQELQQRQQQMQDQQQQLQQQQPH